MQQGRGRPQQYRVMRTSWVDSRLTAPELLEGVIGWDVMDDCEEQEGDRLRG